MRESCVGQAWATRGLRVTARIGAIVEPADDPHDERRRDDRANDPREQKGEPENARLDTIGDPGRAENGEHRTEGQQAMGTWHRGCGIDYAVDDAVDDAAPSKSSVAAAR